MYMQQRTGSFKEDFSKNTFYRFLNSAKTNWLRFTSLLAADIVNNDLKDLTDDSRKNVFIVDDSLFSRTSCKKTELGSKVFDHTDMHFKKGFRMLTLSWSDGNTLIPVNSCLLASAKEANIIGPVKNFDNRTIAGKRRKLAQTKAPEAMMALLDTALSAGLKADYVLFDSWFSNPAQITAIHSKGMDVIAMLKKSSRIKYSYCGEQLNIKEIYSRNKKRRGRSKYLISVDVMVGKENPIPAKIVCVRNKANRKDWLAFICTDTTLSEEEIIRVYGKRWQIEGSFRKLKYTIGLSNFHAYKPESIQQEIWAKLIAYNITETLINHTVVKRGKTQHEYKVNFSRAAHICRVFLRPNPKKDPLDVMALLQKELIPIRNDRKYPRLQTAHFRKPRYFVYRAA
ncbi:hypothetical protein B5F86_13640 [Lachnoclostridium sp. An298]|nr:hypothetical protein B5F86_13640 [Lachnoclostridium sp. An298]